MRIGIARTFAHAASHRTPSKPSQPQIAPPQFRPTPFTYAPTGRNYPPPFPPIHVSIRLRRDGQLHRRWTTSHGTTWTHPFRQVREDPARHCWINDHRTHPKTPTALPTRKDILLESPGMENRPRHCCSTCVQLAPANPIPMPHGQNIVPSTASVRPESICASMRAPISV